MDTHAHTRFPSNVPNQCSVHELNVKCASDFKGIECTNKKKKCNHRHVDQIQFIFIFIKCTGQCEAACFPHLKMQKSIAVSNGFVRKAVFAIHKKKKKVFKKNKLAILGF